MKKKLSLALEALAVDSFETSAGDAVRGTVRGRESDEDPIPVGGGCTCDDSCLCPTNAYYCATVHATVISCDYSYNGSCAYDTKAACGESVDIC
jgi:hypothetical protein